MVDAQDARSGEVKVAAVVRNMSDASDLALIRFALKDILLVAPCGVNPDTMNPVNLGRGGQIAQPLLVQLGAEYRLLARKKRTRFLSLLDVVSSGNYRDGLPPNSAGDAEIARAVSAFLARH